MRIIPPNHFRHAAEVRGAHKDPRDVEFAEDPVEIDLRACEFIRPAAVPWCLIYPLLARARGSSCTVLVPESLGVTLYLKSLGFFDVLHDNAISADDRDIRVRQDPRVVLPITKFSSEYEVDQIGNQVAARLADSGLGAPNLYSAVSEIFSELALNAADMPNPRSGRWGLSNSMNSRNGTDLCVLSLTEVSGFEDHFSEIRCSPTASITTTTLSN